jgi:hypothetical protein
LYSGVSNSNAKVNPAILAKAARLAFYISLPQKPGQRRCPHRRR